MKIHPVQVKTLSLQRWRALDDIEFLAEGRPANTVPWGAFEDVVLSGSSILVASTTSGLFRVSETKPSR
ncbi:MAG: hypothetical protein AAFQ82_23180 [Myxococcota bacterium]